MPGKPLTKSLVLYGAPCPNVLLFDPLRHNTHSPPDLSTNSGPVCVQTWAKSVAPDRLAAARHPTRLQTPASPRNDQLKVALKSILLLMNSSFSLSPIYLCNNMSNRSSTTQPPTTPWPPPVGTRRSAACKAHQEYPATVDGDAKQSRGTPKTHRTHVACPPNCLENLRAPSWTTIEISRLLLICVQIKCNVFEDRMILLTF